MEGELFFRYLVGVLILINILIVIVLIFDDKVLFRVKYYFDKFLSLIMYVGYNRLKLFFLVFRFIYFRVFKFINRSVKRFFGKFLK